MTLVLTVAAIVLPVFFVAGAGFFWAKAGWAYPVDFVTRLTMTLSLPPLIFVALMEAEAPAAELGRVTLAALAAHGVLAVVMAGLVAALGLDRRTYVSPLIFGNTGNLGLPLALFAFGAEGLAHGVAIFGVSAVLTFTFGVWLVSGGGSPARTLREPIVWGTLLGAVFLWRGWSLPETLTRTLELMGQMSIPLMLLTLGVAVAQLRPGRVPLALGLSVAKLGICAAVGWAIGRAFGLPPVAQAVLVLQIAAPAAVTGYLIASRYEADAEAVAGLVVVSTALSVAALPLLLALLL